MQAGSQGGAALIPRLGNYRKSAALFPPQHEAITVLFRKAQFDKCSSKVGRSHALALILVIDIICSSFCHLGMNHMQTTVFSKVG